MGPVLLEEKKCSMAKTMTMRDIDYVVSASMWTAQRIDDVSHVSLFFSFFLQSNMRHPIVDFLDSCAHLFVLSMNTVG